MAIEREDSEVAHTFHHQLFQKKKNPAALSPPTLTKQPPKMSWPAEKPKENGLTHLASGESLLAEQWISSPNDQARLMLEGNGNLTIFKLKGKPHVVRSRYRL